jgi:biopolymer transport protein ExbB/TolQ
MDKDTVVWIVVAAVVVLLLLLLAGFLLKRGAARRNQERLAHAEKLRGEAAAHASDVQSAAQRAEIADTQAARARAQAQQAEGAAAEARRDLAREQASQEDVVRKADELDPRVDTSADDYRPITGPDMKASTVDGTGPTGAEDTTQGHDTDPVDPARHRAN